MPSTPLPRLIPTPNPPSPVISRRFPLDLACLQPPLDNSVLWTSPRWYQTITREEDFVICTRVRFDNLGGTNASFVFRNSEGEHRIGFDGVQNDFFFADGPAWGANGYRYTRPARGPSRVPLVQNDTWHDVTFFRCNGTLHFAVDGSLVDLHVPANFSIDTIGWTAESVNMSLNLLTFNNNTCLCDLFVEYTTEYYDFEYSTYSTFSTVTGGRRRMLSQPGRAAPQRRLIDLVPASSEGIVFTYSADGVVKLVQPRSQELLNDVGIEPIEIYLKNFPSATCAGSCASQVSGVGVQFGTKPGVVQSTTDHSHGMVRVVVLAPAAQVGAVEVTVFGTDRDGELLSVPGGMFTYRRDDAIVAPVDGSTVGGTEVTIMIHGWGTASLVTGPEDVYCDFDGRAAVVLEILDAGWTMRDSWVSFSVLTPAVSQAGTVPCECRAGSQSAMFSFEYFEPSSAIAYPAFATTKGITTHENPEAITLEILDFPFVSSAADLEIAFGPVGICSNSTCEVVTLQSSVDLLSLMITVPRTSAVGDTTVTVTYVGPEAMPLGGEVGMTYVRSVRRATAAFEYIVRLPPADSQRRKPKRTCA